MKNKNMIDAYMTIEASFIVPLMVMITVVIVYWMFYIYNNCVVYQDCYIAALRGSQMMDSSNANIQESVCRYANELLTNQVFQYQINPKIKIDLAKIEVSAVSSIDNKLKTIVNQDVNSYTTERTAKSIRINPVTIIREIY